MSYVQEVLGKDEVVQHSAKVALVRYWLEFLLGGLILLGSLPVLFMSEGLLAKMEIGMFALGILLIVWPFLVRATTELVLTNRRVIAKFGVISRDTVEIGFKKIESIRVNQGVIGRMLNYGNIVITGSGATHAPIQNIANPLEFRRAFDTAMEHFDQMEKSKAAG